MVIFIQFRRGTTRQARRTHADSAVLDFSRSLERGITGSAIGMLGKVWSSGALAVVQNVAIIPGTVHPRDKLEGEGRLRHDAPLPASRRVTSIRVAAVSLWGASVSCCHWTRYDGPRADCAWWHAQAV